MKKIISILLCVALICSLTLTSFAADNGVVEIAEQVYGVKAVEYLKTLEVIDKDADYSLTDKITRGEFAKLACLVSGYPAADPAVVKFSDVPADNVYAPYINSLANAGVINGYSDGTYAPGNEIYMGEAVVMLTTILGYGPYAQAKGGYPAGYYYTASRLDLFDYLDMNGDMTVTITKGEAAQLIANALDTLTLEPTAFGDEPKFSTTDGMTLAYRTFNIVHITGIVESVDISALKGENLTPPWYVQIDGVKIEVGKVSTWDYLGYEVDAYYVEGSSTKKSELKYITKTEYNEETVMAISDIFDISSGKVTYWDEDGKKDDIRFKTVASVIFNGAATGESFDMDMISGYEGEVTLVDNNGNNVADVIFVDAYTDYVVDIVDTTREKIYDRYTTGLSITGDVTADDPYTIIYDSTGEQIGLSGVKVDDVISVYKSKNDADQLLYKLYVSNKTVIGALEAITEENGRTILTVMGSDYKISKAAMKRLEGKYKLGDTVTLYLNMFDEVADIKAGSTLSFGYLLGVDVTSGLGSTAQYKIYADNGQFVYAYGASKVKLDNKTYSAGQSNSIIEKLQAASKVIYPDALDGITAQPIRFRLNGNGELNLIDTIFTDVENEVVATRAEAYGDNALYRGPEGKKIRHRSASGTEIFIDMSTNTTLVVTNGSTTKVIKYMEPSDNEDFLEEKNYSVIKMSSVPAGTEAENLNDVKSFFCNADEEAAPYILLNSAKQGTISNITSLGVVAGVSRVLYNEQPCYKVIIQNNKGKNSVYFKDEFKYTPAKVTDGDATELSGMTASSFKEGDVVKYSADIDGYATNVKLYYRIPENRRVENFEANTQDYQTSSGLVYSKASNAFKIVPTTDKNDLLADSVESTCLVYPTSTTCGYVVYDSQAPAGKRVKGGSFSDVLPYRTVGLEETSYVLMQTTICVPTFMIIVK